MRTLRGVAIILAVALISGTAVADTVTSDRAAALLIFPGILVSPEGNGVDTVISISNTSNQTVAVKCYYVNVLGTCSLSGDRCIDLPGVSGNGCTNMADTCLPQWVETDFQLYLTPQQPLAWLASRGLQRSLLPLDGTFHRGPTGESNAGSGVPPFGEVASNLGGLTGGGELKCYAINSDGTPSDRNVLKGEVTLEHVDSLTAPDSTAAEIDPGIDVTQHDAIGFRAVTGANNGDNVLTLGGDSREYDACPNVLIMDHFFDGASDPVTGETIRSYLNLVPCTENFVNQQPASVTVQYLVYNEFEQRFSTSKPFTCLFFSQLGLIDTADPSRSIFSSNVAGTLTGQTRIRPVNGGIVGVVFEAHDDSTASFNLNVQGERDTADTITVVQ